MKRTGLARKNTRSSGSSTEPKKREAHFVLCLENGEYTASLEPRKVYRVLSDTQAARHGQLRVIDESGEDYLYPQEFFVPIKLPQAAEKAVLRGI